MGGTSDLVISGTLYVDMLPAEVSSPLEFLLVCRRRMHADSCVEPFLHGGVEAQDMPAPSS